MIIKYVNLLFGQEVFYIGVNQVIKERKMFKQLKNEELMVLNGGHHGYGEDPSNPSNQDGLPKPVEDLAVLCGAVAVTVFDNVTQFVQDVVNNYNSVNRN